MSYTKQQIDEQTKGKTNLDEVVSDEWQLSKKKRIDDSLEPNAPRKTSLDDSFENQKPKRVNLNENM